MDQPTTPPVAAPSRSILQPVLIASVFSLLVGLILGKYLFSTPITPTPPSGVTGTLSVPTPILQTYTNAQYGFSFTYPSNYTYQSQGPNEIQTKIDQGQQVSGTVTPSLDTIIFSDAVSTKKFQIEIFSPTSKIISPDDYSNGYLYLFGPCDLRWGFSPTSTSMFSATPPILKVVGPLADSLRILSCYYTKNSNTNLIVFSSIDYSLDQIISTLKFTKSETSSTTGTLFLTITISPTCAGPERPGQDCTGPYANKQLIISKSSGEIVSYITTDSNGQFTTNLSPGNYSLQPYKSKVIGSLQPTAFQIIAGQSTTLNLHVDSGLR